MLHINSLTGEEVKVSLFHIRNRNGDQVLAKGGLSIAICEQDEAAYIGIAVCSIKDRFCKISGRELSLKRMEILLPKKIKDRPFRINKNISIIGSIYPKGKEEFVLNDLINQEIEAIHNSKEYLFPNPLITESNGGN